MTPDEVLDAFEAALLDADRGGATRIVRSLPAVASAELADRLVVPALERVGSAFERGDVALSQVYLAGRICEGLIDELAPLPDPTEAPRPLVGVAALEDHHLLGKRMVLSVLRAAGFVPIDLGHGMGARELARRAREEHLEALLVSVLMLRSATRVKELVALLARDGAPPLPVIVGGAPFRIDPSLAADVGATAWGRSAAEAPRLVAEALARVGGGA
jgi:methanogenic corrinoid protein MtbC1